MYTDKTEQNGLQHRIQHRLQPSTFRMPMSNTSSFRETYLHGKSLLSPSVLEESGGGLGKLPRGVLAPAP